MSLSQTKLKNEILPQVKLISIKAGKKLQGYSKKLGKLKVTSKDAEGMVSQADIETEKLLQRELKKVFKEAEFLGEESVFLKIKDKKKAFEKFKSLEWCWIVDPLDGTHNFLNGLDYYGVCVALAHYGQPVLGVVYRPESSELYYAIQKGKAYKENILSGKKTLLRAEKNTKKLKDCMVVTGFALEKGDRDPLEFKILKKIMEKCRGVRRFGSAALDMCHVAEGKFDSYWEKGLAPWDVAASGIICLEAGVQVTDYNSESFHPFQKSIFCARKPLHKKLIGLI